MKSKEIQHRMRTFQSRICKSADYPTSVGYRLLSIELDGTLANEPLTIKGSFAQVLAKRATVGLL